jgi:hypothetical protein
MGNLVAPDIVYGAFALAAVVLFAAWSEVREKNHRDAKLLSTVGVAALAGSAALWFN